jgi:MYXO-CTERM domain-containing protein
MRARITVLITAAALLAPASASAFCRSTTCNPKKEQCDVDDRKCVTSGVPVRWSKLPLEYRFSARGSALLVREEARAAIRDAFNRWSDTLCDGRRTSLRFVEQEDLPEDKPLGKDTQGSEPFGIYFRDLGWPYDTPDETLAQTNHLFGKSSGVIQYADLEINTGATKFATTDSADGVDLQAVVTHEVGHYIGLAHSIENESIMVKSYCEVGDRCEKGKVAARRLAADDIAAVCALYPPDGISDADSPSDTSSAKGCSASPSSRSEGLAVLGLFVLGLAVARRRR